MLEKFKFIDLFCGIGGFHQAMASLGGECVFASDIDKFCQDTYFKNYGIMPVGDITKVDAADIPEHDVLCGGFPCQAFSIAGKRLGFADPTKGTLFFDIMRIINHHHPKYVLLENVRNLASHDHGNTWKVIHQSLVDAGYNVSPEPVIFSPHYIGIPQHRERVFIMGIRQDLGELPNFYFNRRRAKPCSIDTVLQDESEIPNIKRYRMKQVDIDIVNLWNEFLHGLAERNVKMPCFPVTDLFLYESVKRFNYDVLMPQKAATARRNVELYNQASDFIDKWLEKAYQNPKFRGARRMLEWHAGKKTDTPDLWDTVLQFRQSGIRARPPYHFPTLTAVVQIPIIGKRQRRLTPRECARLQSFPDTFQYDDNEHQAYKQFGNSVNVEVVKLFARFLLGDTSVHETYQIKEEDIPKPKKRGRPRKYPLPEDGGEPRVPRKRGRPRKYPLSTDGAEPMPVDPNAPVAPRRRGRPRKYPLPVAPAIIDGAQPTEISAAPAVAPAPKRRGRPRVHPQIDVFKDIDPNIPPTRPLPPPQEPARRGRPKRDPNEPPKKRGRPRKYPLPPEGEAPAPKRRGRPRKEVAEGETPHVGRPRKENQLTEGTAPRRRGRPRKLPPTDSDATGQQPRRRGRPRKQPEDGMIPPKRKRGRPRKNSL